MTATTSGVVRAAHVSGLGAVERELAAMHHAMLRAGGDAARAVRLSVMTLVVACTDESEADRAADVVAAIATQHPARALLVTANRDDEPGIEADLRLECSVAGGSGEAGDRGGSAAVRPGGVPPLESQVCAEIVRLRVGGEPALHLTSIVEPLLLPDVPVRLWIVGAPPLEQGFSSAVLELVERIVLDTDAFEDSTATLRMLADAMQRSGGRLPLTDLAWLRMEPWREAIARVVDPVSERALLAGIDSVRVSASGRSSALLAAGWLVSRLGLDASRVTVAIDVAGDGGLQAVHIHASGTRTATIEVTAARDGLSARVEGDDGIRGDSVPLDAPSLVELVGAALEEGNVDAVYADALRSAVELAG